MKGQLFGAVAALALLSAASAAFASQSQTTPVLQPDGSYFAQFTDNSVSGAFTDTFTFPSLTNGSGDATLSATWKSSATPAIVFTSVTLNGIALDLLAFSTGVLGITPTDVNIPAGQPLVLKVSGTADPVRHLGFNGNIYFTPNPAPAPLAAGLPLLLTAGALFMRRRRAETA
jgi:hypothetical protein